MVTRRRFEFGVRLALGARRAQIIGLVIRDAARMMVIGLTIGVAGAIAAAHLLRSQLYGVSPRDLTSYGIAVPTIAVAVLLASWLPATRSANTSPRDILAHCDRSSFW